jgi:hypothetical protein
MAWVVSKNLHRRHLNELQRGMVAGRLLKFKQLSQTEAAEALN